MEPRASSSRASPPGAEIGSEAVQHALVRGPAEPDRQDDRLAAQPGDVRQVGDDERLGAAGVEERGEREVGADLAEHGLADGLGVRRASP